MFESFNGITLLAIVFMAFLILWAFNVYLEQKDREDARDKDFKRFREYLMHLESMAESGDTINTVNEYESPSVEFISAFEEFESNFTDVLAAQMDAMGLNDAPDNVGSMDDDENYE